jgi:hypothetical protein
MKRFRPIILALTLIITLSSAAHAGNIGGLRTNAAGNIGGLRTNAAGNIGGLRTNGAGNIGGMRTNSTPANTDIEILFYGNIAGLIRALLSTSALV